MSRKGKFWFGLLSPFNDEAVINACVTNGSEMPQSLHDQGCSRVSFLNEPGPSLRTPATQLFGKTGMHSGAYESVGLTDFFFYDFPQMAGSPASCQY